MSTLCTRTLVACPLRSTGITPGFSVCSCPSCEALGYRGDPQCSQCGGRGCSSARGDHESSASALPCECQRHRRERKCWHSALDASARASSAKIGQPCCFDEGLHRCKRTSHSSRRIYAATLMVNRMSRSVRVGPPAPSLARFPRKFQFPFAT
jgi:hypothetical protein